MQFGEVVWIKNISAFSIRNQQKRKKNSIKKKKERKKRRNTSCDIVTGAGNMKYDF